MPVVLIQHKLAFSVYNCSLHPNLKDRVVVSLTFRALRNNLAKMYNARNHFYAENFNLKFCTCAQSIALDTRTKFQIEILIRNTISAIHKFRENILESSRNVSETTPRLFHGVHAQPLVVDINLTAVRPVQWDRQWKYPLITWAQKALQLSHPHKLCLDQPANWKPCLIPYWQSYGHQVRAV